MGSFANWVSSIEVEFNCSGVSDDIETCGVDCEKSLIRECLMGCRSSERRRWVKQRATENIKREMAQEVKRRESMSTPWDYGRINFTYDSYE